MKTIYRRPDFTEARFRTAPSACFVPAPSDGVLPEGFFATSNLPTYVKIDDRWLLPRAPRMDAAIVLEPDGSLLALEGRYVREGQPVAIGRSEDGSEGIYVHAAGFVSEAEAAGHGEFQFMSSEVSREKPVDYERMAELLHQERARGGHIVWVLGPAVLHARGRDVVTWFIEQGFVNAVLGGNAIGVHDIEQALMGTTLGMDRSGRPRPGGHSFHVRAINQIRAAGSIPEAVEQGILREGIMHACVTNNVPFILAGSIRDDGPLPDTITDAVEAQELMREHAMRTTMVIMIATALHAIAFGNMLPAYVVEDQAAGMAGEDAGAEPGEIRPLTTIVVDSSEFVVNKLKDRGPLQAFGVITNAQDFLHVLRHFVEQTPAPSKRDGGALEADESGAAEINPARTSSSA
jgi:lysine-ketoglutarate reductase/saccharopine dehydrogenase-like protein (TIGR00300 family)